MYPTHIVSLLRYGWQDWTFSSNSSL